MELLSMNAYKFRNNDEIGKLEAETILILMLVFMSPMFLKVL